MRKKLKYQGGLTKVICQQMAAWHKNNFSKNIFAKVNFLNYKDQSVDFDVISLSGVFSFEDQILSIYSFIKYAGIPHEWVLYSDGSYSDLHKGILKNLFPFVTIVNWDESKRFKDNKYLKEYLQIDVMAKKLTTIISHNCKRQTIYIDSDVISYKNLGNFLKLPILKKGLWYLPDDNMKDVFSEETKFFYKLNAGLLFINSNFNSDDVFTYLESLNGKYTYFSEQSSFEYSFRNQNAQPLDPRQFVLNTADQFDFSNKYHPEEMAMRHYVTPVRHKIWQNGWKWHFED